MSVGGAPPAYKPHPFERFLAERRAHSAAALQRELITMAVREVGQTWQLRERPGSTPRRDLRGRGGAQRSNWRMILHL